ncbi:probable gluconokinase isoform X2 [Ptychodera flava]
MYLSFKMTLTKTIANDQLIFDIFCQLSWSYVDADDYHTESNKLKMSSGIPLTDEDRLPWLLGLHRIIRRWIESSESGILGCSALKKTYRDILVYGDTSADRLHPPDHDKSKDASIVIVYLKGTEELLQARMSARKNHFMPSSLLQSQLETVEPPQGENSITVDIDKSVKDIVTEIISQLDIK